MAEPFVLRQKAYCPRCDKKFFALTRVLAWASVMQHVKKAHSDYLPMMQD